jgi:hypothetical protein
MLNILTEHDFQDEFKKWQKLWKRRIRAEGYYFECDGSKQAQSWFLKRASVPELIDGSLQVFMV